MRVFVWWHIELIESAMYLYKATGDPTFLQLGRDAVESIEKISRVKCGFASVSDKRQDSSPDEALRGQSAVNIQ